SQATIQVIDDGEGISPEFLPLIFERFRQADSAKTRTHGGLGLGLAIVRELVHAQGGSVVAESPGKGQGSTFTVMFPLSLMMPAEPATLVPEQEQTAQPSISRLRVLVVDDDSDARELAAVILGSRGALVQIASSAREALQAIDRNDTDLLI